MLAAAQLEPCPTTGSRKSDGTERKEARLSPNGEGRQPWHHLRISQPPAARFCLCLLCQEGNFSRKAQATTCRARAPHSRGVEERSTGSGTDSLSSSSSSTSYMTFMALGKLLLCKLVSSSVNGTMGQHILLCWITENFINKVSTVPSI